MLKDNARKINNHFLESSKLIRNSIVKLSQPIIQTSELLTQTFKAGNKLLICGNGGSAAESQHFSAELVVRYLKEHRKPLPAIALNTDSSSITALGNDYGFTKIFSRQVEAYGKQGDVLFCISTSGNSANVILAAKKAKSLKLKVIGLTGNGGGKLKSYCDINLIVPSGHTPYIQEVHLTTIHTLCELLLNTLFKPSIT